MQTTTIDMMTTEHAEAIVQRQPVTLWDAELRDAAIRKLAVTTCPTLRDLATQARRPLTEWEADIHTRARKALN